MTNKEKIELFFKKGYTINNFGLVFNINLEQLKGSIHLLAKGYERKEISIRDGKTKYNLSVHRLQAYKKYGDKIFNEENVVRHLNGNSLDNSWDNIGIGSSSDNMMDIPKKVRVNRAITASRKQQNNKRSLEEREVIYLKILNGITYDDIIKDHEIPKSTLSYMKNHSLEYKNFVEIVRLYG